MKKLCLLTSAFFFVLAGCFLDPTTKRRITGFTPNQFDSTVYTVTVETRGPAQTTIFNSTIGDHYSNCGVVADSGQTILGYDQTKKPIKEYQLSLRNGVRAGFIGGKWSVGDKVCLRYVDVLSPGGVYNMMWIPMRPEDWATILSHFDK